MHAVRELMTGALVTVGPETALLEARELMRKERIRHLLVTEDRRLVGIVTDRDIRLHLPSQATSLSAGEVNYLLARLPVSRVMARTLVTVEPDRDARAAAQLMLDHRIGCLPVLEGHALVGIITETDVVRAFVRSRPAAMAEPS